MHTTQRLQALAGSLPVFLAGSRALRRNTHSASVVRQLLSLESFCKCQVEQDSSHKSTPHWQSLLSWLTSTEYCRDPQRDMTLVHSWIF